MNARPKDQIIKTILELGGEKVKFNWAYELKVKDLIRYNPVKHGFNRVKPVLT